MYVKICILNVFFKPKVHEVKKWLFNSISAAYLGISAMEEIQDVLLILLK